MNEFAEISFLKAFRFKLEIEDQQEIGYVLENAIMKVFHFEIAANFDHSFVNYLSGSYGFATDSSFVMEFPTSVVRIYSDVLSTTLYFRSF